MLIVSNGFILAAIAFLTVNSIVSVLKLVVCSGFPLIKQLLKSNSVARRHDFEPLFAAAESFNVGLLDRAKWRRALRNANKFKKPEGEQKLISIYNIFILVIILCIVGAEIMVLVILSPQRFNFRASEADIPMHQVRTSIDKSLSIPDQKERLCDKIYVRKMLDTETVLWQSRACMEVGNINLGNIGAEGRRARATGDKLRFRVLTYNTNGKEAVDPGVDGWTALFWVNAFSPANFVLGRFSVSVSALGSGDRNVYEYVPASLVIDLHKFALERKFGSACDVRDLSTNKTHLVLAVACNQSVGNMVHLLGAVTRSAKQMYTRGSPHTLYGKVAGKPKGPVFNPVVKVRYGINLSSWRMIFPACLVLLAVVSTLIRTLTDKEVSSEALCDILRKKEGTRDLITLPFSEPATRLQSVDLLSDFPRSWNQMCDS